MFKRSLWIALGLVALVVFFTVMPTGTNASDVLDGYQNTLSLTRSGTLPYQFMDVIEAKDPLLVEVENKAGSHVDYLWVTDDGTPITMEQTKVSLNCTPKVGQESQRKGCRNLWEKNCSVRN